jgi:amino acid adenylation domain-containing protein
MKESPMQFGQLPTEERALLLAAIKESGAEFNLFPLSYSQERLWFLNQLEPGVPSFNVPATINLSGKLNVMALGQSLNEIVRRHEVLRTAFIEIDGYSFQSVSPNLHLWQGMIDLSGLAETDAEGAGRILSMEEGRRPFELTAAPLLRAGLVRVGKGEQHILMLTMHHIVSDGWSVGVFAKEVAQLYKAFLIGIPSPLPELPIQYIDYAVWQRKRLTGEMVQQQLDFLADRLRDSDPTLELPIARPHAVSGTHDGSRKPFAISEEVTAKMKALARQEGSTLFMVLLAAFQMLLHRYSGKEEINIGTSIAGRTREETEGLIGCFLNTLVLRVDASNDPTFLQLLSRVREAALGAYANQDVPVEMLLESIQVGRSPSYNPLFQVMCILQNTPEPDWNLMGLDVALAEVDNGTAKFDLTLDVKEEQRTLSGKIEYHTGLFDEASIDRLIDSFQMWLEWALTTPSLPISSAPFMKPEEARQVLVEWNETRSPYSREKCIHQLFEAQADAAPDVIAVVNAEAHITYDELNRRANQLGRQLRALGVSPDVSVAICVERSIEMVVGLLGILKAGGAYIPLDPAYPNQRLAYILDDSKAEVILAQRSTVESLAGAAAKVLCLDDDWYETGTQAYDNLQSHVAAENLAYFIYTSGSTGGPKGVMVRHSSLVNYTEAAVAKYGIAAGDRVLQFASINFDTSAEEIYPCLIGGGTLVLRTGDFIDSVSIFRQKCLELCLTVLDLPTAYWHELTADLNQPGLAPSVRLVIIGGEKALIQSLVRWKEIGQKHIQLVNTYGPTEATIVATVCDLSQADGKYDALQTVPVGNPAQNVRTYIFDSHMQPVPVGFPGELYIGGAGVARGYLGRPDLTAEKFVPDPYAEEESLRLYQSGDLVRYLRDGAIEFLGRADRQIKIRGFRVEAGEIELALNQHPALRESIVIPYEASPGDTRLVAYILPGQDGPPRAADLRAFLKERVPDYMVPASFMNIDALPLTANGKVDRKSLPTPDFADSEPGGSCDLPRTPVQELLASIWCEVLGLDRVGINSDFFALGGHSLLATRLVARVRDTFQVELPLRVLFESPNIAALAESIEALRNAKDQVKIPPIKKAPNGLELPLSFAQERIWFLNNLDSDNASYNVPRAIRFRGHMRLDLMERTLTELVTRHEVLRTAFPTVKGRPVQVINAPFYFSIQLTDLSDLCAAVREEEVATLIVAQGQKPFDLASGNLLRVTMAHMGKEDHVLILTEHHLVHDGWTQGVLLNDFLKIYGALAADEPPFLPELPIQYSDYAYWQRQWLRGEVLGAQLSFWKSRLAGAPPMLELPLDKPRPAIQTSRGAQDTLFLKSHFADAIRALCRRKGVTLYMLMQAAFKTLLLRYTGQEDIVIASGIANRRWRELEGLLGMIINTVVFRTDLHGNPSFFELLDRTREVCLSAYAHQDTPFEKLVEELHPERNLSFNPIFQVMYNFQDAPSQLIHLPGLAAEVMESHNFSAKFDMTITVQPRIEQFIGSDTAGVENEILVMWEYNTDLFETGTMLRMLKHYQVLLAGIIEDANCPVQDLPLLTAEERFQLASEWNLTEALPDTPLQQIFETYVELAPDFVSLEFREEHLTYRDLNRRANRLGHYLARLGVGAEIPVAVVLEHSLDSVVVPLAILKAGGIYFPIAPSTPKERLAFMLEDARTEVLITTRSLASSLPRAGMKMVLIDEDWIDVPAANDQNPVARATLDNAAYLIYTSGSTGRPKGVLGIGRAVLNRFRWMWQAYDFGPRAIFCRKAASSVVDSIWETFGSVLRGGRTVIVSDADAKDPSKLVEVLATTGVTRMVVVPTLLRALLDTFGDLGAKVPALKHWTSSGETLQTDLELRFKEKVPGAVLLNLYGSTEVMADVTCYQIGDSGPAATSYAGTALIGRAISNIQVALADRGFHQVPAGVKGEILIGGAGLARCYVNRPDLTAERFITDPFGQHFGSRLYRTGDLGRRMPDGNLEYLGRIDNQVKVRGFRVELDEIEYLLTQHQSVRRAAVTVINPDTVSIRLAAYVVADPDQQPSVEELRRFLAEKLPDYMTPTDFVFLAEMPLTSSGKIDRRSLPSPDRSGPEGQKNYVGPRNQVEDLLAGIWANVLGVEKVGVLDNFFDLGGHSLLGTQVMSRIREAFQTELPLRSLFENPSVAGLAERVQHAGRAREETRLLPIKPAPRGIDPASYSQQRLWFQQQIEPKSYLYNLGYAIRLSGRLNFAALWQSLNEIVNRHEALRTTLDIQQGRLCQLIHPVQLLTLAVSDLCELGGAEQEDKCAALSSQEARRQFKLEQWPLLRVSLLHLRDYEHLLVVTMHHIISDAWSGGVFVKEFSALYDDLDGGRPPSLPPLSVQYVDFAVWQREWLRGETLEREKTFWRQRLADAPTVLEIPADRPRPPVQTFRGRLHRFVLDGELTGSLRECGAREEATPFMVMLAAFYVLLYRYTQQQDILVYTPIAGRNRLETEGLIGLFVNMLVVRAQLSGQMPFRTLLRKVREAVLESQANQDLPFDMLVAELRLAHDPSRNPLAQVGFDFHNQPAPEFAAAGLTMSTAAIETDTAKADLILVINEGRTGLSGYFEYSTDLFDAMTIARMAGHLCALLEVITATPQKKISALRLAPEEERSQILLAGDKPAIEPLRRECIHQLFEARVESMPESIAVEFDGEQMTFGELNRRANKLAGRLYRMGVAPEGLVGIFMERSLEILTALLGILKVGAAYLPLDVTYPEERLAFMLEDAGTDVLVSKRHWEDRIPRKRALAICIDGDWESIEEESDGNPANVITPANAAYVVYTSGSTGLPKGVVGLHGGAVNRFDWMWRTFPFEAGEVCCQKTSLNFLDSVWEIFGPVSQGIRLVIIPDLTVRDSHGFVGCLADNLVSRIVLVPSLLQTLLDTVEDIHNKVPVLKYWTSSGEALSADLLKRFRSSLPGRLLLNLYGSSELSADATWYDTREFRARASVAIGRPISNVDVRIFGSDMEPVPRGLSGEVYSGGVGLARCYIHRSDLTAERFVPDPVGYNPGARLYRTGDLARYPEDGNLEYLGRADHQVKLRGYRIELGEIEAALGQHPEVREAVVIARQENGGRKRLIGYAVAAQGAAPTPEELQGFLQKKLVGYMVPSQLVILPEMPRTPSGKINRPALPIPVFRAFQRHKAYIPLSTANEKKLGRIFTEVLGVPELGAGDNFLELGGDSITGIHIIARANHLGLKLTPRQLFECKSLAELGAVAEIAPETAPDVGALGVALPSTGVRSISEFPGARLNQKELDNLLSRFSREGEGN